MKVHFCCFHFNTSLYHEVRESILLNLALSISFQCYFIWPLACLFTSDVTPDSYKKGCDDTGCIFSSLKHLFVIVLNLWNHFVCRVELQAPYNLSTKHALQFLLKPPEHLKLKKIRL